MALLGGVFLSLARQSTTQYRDENIALFPPRVSSCFPLREEVQKQKDVATTQALEKIINEDTKSPQSDPLMNFRLLFLVYVFLYQAKLIHPNLRDRRYLMPEPWRRSQEGHATDLSVAQFGT